MRNAERVAMYAGLSLAIGLGLAGATGVGRTAHADATQRAADIRLGTVDTLAVMEALLQSPRYTEAMTRRQEELRAPLTALEPELQAMQTRLQGMDQNSPDYAQASEEFRTKIQQYQAAGQEAQQAVAALSMDQIKEAYRLTLETANAVATRMGYTHVIGSRAGDASFRSPDANGAFQELLARPMLKSDPADDLTQAVMKELDVTPPPAPATEPAPGAAPAAPGEAAPAQPAPAPTAAPGESAPAQPPAAPK